MPDIPALLRMLNDENPNMRYDACEQLRVAPSIPSEASTALFEATHDSNLDVADAAKRALAIHPSPPPTQSAVAVPSTPAYTPPSTPMNPANATEYTLSLERRLAAAEAEIHRLSEVLRRATVPSNGENPMTKKDPEAQKSAWSTGAKIATVITVLAAIASISRYSNAPAELIGSLTIGSVATFVIWWIVCTVLVWGYRKVTKR